MEGKTTLHQRVLTRPGAMLAEQPGSAKGSAQPPFTRYYVYERRVIDGNEWLQVGATANCRTEGWLSAETTVEWKQQLTVAFDNPAGRDPVLFFENSEDLEEIVRSSEPAAGIDPILKTLRSGGTDERVLAREPETYIDFTREFYLLPILDFQETLSDSRQLVHLLRVASVAKNPGVKRSDPPPPPPNAAVVFVIDSSISMGPYIERTKEAVRRIYAEFRNSRLGDQVKFGLVAFRANIEAVPDLEYTVRLFADPGEPDFLQGVADLKPAPVSSSKFDEDAYAGVMLALEAVDWSGFLGRNIVLITDAGALDASDPLSKTHKNAGEMRAAAKDRKVVVYALHLKTPAGHANHAKAAGQYRDLTYHDQAKESLYYSIDVGSVQAFGAQIDCLTKSVVDNVGRIDPATGNSGGGPQPCPAQGGDISLQRELDKMGAHAEVLGHALRLEYLGRLRGTQVPPVFEAWIPDRDPKAPTRPNVQVRVLLTRNELSNLAAGVQGILEAAQVGQSSPNEMYRKLLSLASTTVRDPNLAKRGEGLKIAEMGILGEYLDGLPYKSAVMEINQDTWERKTATEQYEFINRIKNKLERYGYYEGDRDGWQKIAEHGDPGEEVYPVLLDALP